MCYNKIMNTQKLLEQWLQKGLEEGTFPSATAAVGRGAEVLAAACAGVTRQGGPEVNLDTRYDMASCTKVLAPTMIALKAIEEGLLTMDDTVGLFFDAPEDTRDITCLLYTSVAIAVGGRVAQNFVLRTKYTIVIFIVNIFIPRQIAFLCHRALIGQGRDVYKRQS